jgi:hypothetical protein
MPAMRRPSPVDVTQPSSRRRVPGQHDEIVGWPGVEAA